MFISLGGLFALNALPLCSSGCIICINLSQIYLCIYFLLPAQIYMWALSTNFFISAIRFFNSAVSIFSIILFPYWYSLFDELSPSYFPLDIEIWLTDLPYLNIFVIMALKILLISTSSSCKSFILSFSYICMGHTFLFLCLSQNFFG